MCGRYALGIRAAFVRHQLQQQGFPVDDAPNDEDVRETYNFPPGAYGLVYRADIPDNGVTHELSDAQQDDEQEKNADVDSTTKFQYHLKAMKWGLIPFWTKRSPDYGSMMRTINCRDDSLLENKGMWSTMKHRKRCLVVAQGFYEWLKKGPGGKDKIPHFVKRADGELMCFAGLWDCVKYEDSEDKLYTYTIITTDSNRQLKFLHDRMPVILEPNSEAMKMWLDPLRNKWSSDLQNILKPFEGSLDCYQVSKDVGKVGNNSPDFIVPIDSKENKSNIANFFGSQSSQKSPAVQKESQEPRATKDSETSENHAPMPVPNNSSTPGKRKRSNCESAELPDTPQIEEGSPNNKVQATDARKSRARSATSNANTRLKKRPERPAQDGSQRITNFFNK